MRSERQAGGSITWLLFHRRGQDDFFQSVSPEGRGEMGRFRLYFIEVSLRRSADGLGVGMMQRKKVIKGNFQIFCHEQVVPFNGSK